MDGAAIIQGITGSLQWAYYRAAVVEGYTVTGRGPKGARVWTLRARLVWRDPYKLSQRPLLFVAPHQHGVWRWPIVSCESVGDELRAQLGPVEER